MTMRWSKAALAQNAAIEPSWPALSTVRTGTKVIHSARIETPGLASTVTNLHLLLLHPADHHEPWRPRSANAIHPYRSQDAPCASDALNRSSARLWQRGTGVNDLECQVHCSVQHSAAERSEVIGGGLREHRKMSCCAYCCDLVSSVSLK